ncbi:Septal ring factor EnvC, activator of murein hydrolases AmiA and AmiB [Nitrosomonas sp. Nm51]|uniref:murein hydrolase activator EnvC family protein n=1 Tax=Nitrosomonas sp. Nm51 TaxID=133720 RepID=UPI0008CA2852|nr:peptidoglycan DD-metalloendopeptidase family protein [Nitrosomonas sp. Nm51]SEQ85650.1 Septal ring factor EnvC, activator of murein hydrolases AmiA and AmiB [Nitrosomonas sp. Nm51]
MKPAQFTISSSSVFLVLSCILLLCHSPANASEKQQQLEKLRSRIKVLHTELAAQEINKQDAVDALRDTEHAISDIKRKQFQLKKDKQKIEDALKRVSTQHRQLKLIMEAEQDQLSELLFQQYLGNERNYLRTLLNLQDPNQIARDIYYYQQLFDARATHIDNLHNGLNQLQTLAQSVREKRAQFFSIETEYAHQSQQLKQEQLKHKTTLARISKEIEQQHNEIGKLIRDEQRITKLVNEITRIFKQENQRNTLNNTRLPNSKHQDSAFKTLKGKLNLPVRGKLVHRFGGQRSGRHVKWKGLFIRSAAGSDVKVIATGQVVFADWLRGFGNLIIIDHSQDYMSLYGNNEMLLKQVGEIVKSGDTIATVGNSGGNPEAGLYFELRHKGKAFDPLTWIKIE